MSKTRKNYPAKFKAQVALKRFIRGRVRLNIRRIAIRIGGYLLISRTSYGQLLLCVWHWTTAMLLLGHLAPKDIGHGPTCPPL